MLEVNGDLDGLSLCRSHLGHGEYCDGFGGSIDVDSGCLADAYDELVARGWRTVPVTAIALGGGGTPGSSSWHRSGRATSRSLAPVISGANRVV